MRQSIENKTALITGGSKGIGYGIAAALMAEGMHVAITSRSLSAAQKAADELNQSGK
ncbi:SDR family NAD(P)-dependent oxidoreductase, partial [Cecembia lonarensis]|uniref:SDR family NAD(P)-dependent oxidoreductase n=1 Tax=Cecembia lonarensis TaxID=645110 RepID=UPI0012F977F1